MAQRSGIPPWHLWGGSQQINGVIETTGAIRLGTAGQLVKISYARPESWHWLFQAKLISGPDNTPTFFSRIFVHWDLVVGIGRSAIRLVALENPARVQGFDDYQFQWGPTLTNFPQSAMIWSTQTLSPVHSFSTEDFVADSIPVSEIVAQDIQLSVTVVGLTIPANLAAAGQPFTVEVSAQFAPKTHIRPEWHNKIFPGAEDGGGTSVSDQVNRLNYPGTPIRRT